jgi:hypothetical protein
MTHLIEPDASTSVSDATWPLPRSFAYGRIEL